MFYKTRVLFPQRCWYFTSSCTFFEYFIQVSEIKPWTCFNRDCWDFLSFIMAHVSPTIKDVAGHKLLQGAIDKLTFAKKKLFIMKNSRLLMFCGWNVMFHKPILWLKIYKLLKNAWDKLFYFRMKAIRNVTQQEMKGSETHQRE